MRFFDYFRLAFKNLSRQKIRTSLTIVAITIGSLSIILMASLLTTIRNSIYDFFEDMDAFTLVTVYPDPDSADNNNSLISGNNGPSTEGKILNDQTVADLKKIAHVADATPIGGNLWVKNMTLEGQTKKTWCNVIAYDPATNVFNMPLLVGRSLKSTDMDKIIVSTEFVKKYGDPQKPEDLIGKNVVFIFEGYYYPDWGDLVPEKPPEEGDNKAWWDEQQKKTIEVPAEIIGIAKSSTFDSSQNYINIAWAKKLMTQQMWEWQSNCSNEEMKYGYDCKSGQVLTKYDNFAKNGYSSIILKADDMNNIKGIGEAAAKLGYGVNTAQDMLDEINRMLLAIGTVLGIIGGISLFVAAIGIINTMVMATYERTREIGVMRACGATRGTIRRLFTFEAALLGLIGGIFGLILSYGIGKSANWIAVKYITSVNLPFDKVASFPWWLIIGVLAFTTLVGLFSGLGPAIKAARLNPVDALRYE